MNTASDTEWFETVVVGGGQAGLSVGYHLARRKLDFVILDANDRIGDSWRKRWDSLRLFTPARFNGLDGMRFPGAGDTFSTKDEVADYLETYAAHFGLPPIGRHHAIADAYAGAQLLLLALEQAQRLGLATAGDLLDLEKSQRWLGRRR